jgi:flagellar hook-length control protein FliK
MKNEQTNQVRNMEQVYQKIKDMTQLISRQQTRTELATIKLNPPELGRVSLEVVKEGNKISILMQVETKEAQEILNKNSNLLAARLVNSGFELQKVTVQMEKYEEQGNNQSNQNKENNSQQQENENQDNNNENEYGNEEEYTFADLLKGGIEENAS